MGGGADIEKATDGAVKGRFINSGQSCIASKRFIVEKKISKEFIEKFVQKTEKLNVGDPMSDNIGNPYSTYPEPNTSPYSIQLP